MHPIGQLIRQHACLSLPQGRFGKQMQRVEGWILHYPVHVRRAFRILLLAPAQEEGMLLWRPFALVITYPLADSGGIRDGMPGDGNAVTFLSGTEIHPWL